MGNHRKIGGAVFLAGAAAVAALFLAGLWNGAENREKSKECVITVWTKDRHDADFQQRAVKQYNETNTDGIRVEYKILGDNYPQAVNSALVSGSAPDLMAYTSQIFYNHLEDGVYADLTPFMDEAFRQSFQSVMVEGTNVIDGRCYYLPTSASICRLFYNKTIFEKAGIAGPPETMEELIETARVITEKLGDQGIYGFAINLKNPRSAFGRSLMRQEGLQLGIKQGFDFASGCYDFARYEELVRSWRKLLSPECSYPDCAGLDIDPLRQLFAKGKIGMYMSYVHAETAIYGKQMTMTDEWGMADIPVDGPVAGSQSYAGTNGYLLNAKSDHLEEAWKVYRAVFADLDHLAEYDAEGYGISIIPEVIERAAVLRSGENQQPFRISGRDKIWPIVPHELNPDAVEVDGNDLYDSLKDLILGDEEIAPVLDALTKRYNQAYVYGLKNHLGQDMQIPGFDPKNP